jgi:hypothetical protein
VKTILISFIKRCKVNKSYISVWEDRRGAILALYFIPLAVVILFYINKLTNTLCVQREIPEEKQPKVFRTINVLITILLITSYIEVLFT